MTLRPLLIGVAALGGLACSSATTEPPEPEPVVRNPAGVYFSIHAGDSAVVGASNPPGIEIQTGRIVVRGILPAPTLCYRAYSRVDGGPDSVNISLWADSTGNFGCYAWGGPRYYRVIVDRPAGPLRLRVQHWIVHRSDDWVTDTAVVVP